MTNEEKAREIAEYYTDINDFGVALNSAKEIANWKDQQFKEYLEKKRNDMIMNFNVTRDGDFLTKRGVYEKIINELFKED